MRCASGTFQATVRLPNENTLPIAWYASPGAGNTEIGRVPPGAIGKCLRFHRGFWELELPPVTERRVQGLVCALYLLSFLAPFCFIRVWSFPPASKALTLEKKLLEQNGAFFFSFTPSLLGGGDPFKGSPRTHICADEAEMPAVEMPCPCSPSSRRDLGPGSHVA